MRESQNVPEKNQLTRRDFLKTVGIGVAGIALGASGMLAVPGVRAFFDDNPSAKNKINFYGAHQPGILTQHPKHVYFVALNCLAESQNELKELFQVWTDYSVRFMNGEMLPNSSNQLLPPQDTGEAQGLGASRLTLTFGVGPSLFDKPGLGLADKRPAELKDLPHFPRDQIDEKFSGGDLCIQACADDAQVAFHAVRNLIRVARGKVTMKWAQAGFNSYPMRNNKIETPRNLFAFKDGTGNPKVDDEQLMNQVVWVQPGDTHAWLAGGTYMVVRKIQMHLEVWDRTSLKEQEQTFGRHRDSGAPLGKTREFDDMELDRLDEKGNRIVPEDSHVYLAKQAGAQILRRSFSYVNDVNPATGQFDAGLLFISFQRSPQQFIEIQKTLGRADRLNEYITHRGSALFACFPGVAKGSYLGEGLFV